MSTSSCVQSGKSYNLIIKKLKDLNSIEFKFNRKVSALFIWDLLFDNVYMQIRHLGCRKELLKNTNLHLYDPHHEA
jgi:hypothetical protein